MGNQPTEQKVTQKTEIDPIQKSFLFGTPLPDDYATAMENHNQFATGGQGGNYAQGGIVGLPTGMAPPMTGGGMPNLSNREQAYLMGAQALQGAMQPMMQGYAMGGYVEGPGTGRSDDIPATIYQNGVPVQDAALSDGEFVMTERAVRNAGGGDREAGAARMYEMMQRFENAGGV